MKSDRFFLNQCNPKGSISSYEEYSRSKFLQNVCESEVVQCIVFGTYRVEKTCFESEFLNNMGNKKIPILVLHGRKALDEDDSDNNNDWVAQIPDNQDWLAIWEVVPSFRCIDKSFHQTHGCHHPKYLLIFTDQGMHISISTSNLTNTVSVDGTWNQFFPKVVENEEYDCLNDFGSILEDFIIKESENIRYNIDNDIATEDLRHRNILKWICSYTLVSSISTGYDYNGAEVDLITTVPCRQPLPTLTDLEIEWLYDHHNISSSLRKSEPCAKCRMENSRISMSSSNAVQYGSFRVNKIIVEKEREFPRPLKSSDHFVAQPTSIGSIINNQYISSWLETLMPDEYWKKFPDKLRQDSWRLIWPSSAYMNEVKSNVSMSMFVRGNTHKKSTESNNGNAITDHINNGKIVEAVRPFRTGIVFLNPKVFAFMEPDIQSVFHTYEPNCIPSLDLDWKKVPHIKTYTRLMQGIHPPADKFRNSHVVPHCICWKVAWSWLTSACLSKGAQGEEIPYTICNDCRHVRQGYREFRNFELGVLFRSTKTRQYFALNNACSVCTRAKPFHKITATRINSPSKASQVKHEKLQYSSLASIPKRYAPIRNITLPYPFHISKAKPYCDHRGKLIIDPYFHEDLQMKGQFVGSKLEVTPKYRKFNVQIPINNESFDRIPTFPTPISTTKRKMSDEIIDSDKDHLGVMRRAYSADEFLITSTGSIATIMDLTEDSVLEFIDKRSPTVADVTSSPCIDEHIIEEAGIAGIVSKANERQVESTKLPIIAETPSTLLHMKSASEEELSTIPAYHNMIQTVSSTVAVNKSPENVLTIASPPSRIVPSHLRLSYAFRFGDKKVKSSMSQHPSPSECRLTTALKGVSSPTNDENNLLSSNSLEETILDSVDMSEIAV